MVKWWWWWSACVCVCVSACSEHHCQHQLVCLAITRFQNAPPTWHFYWVTTVWLHFEMHSCRKRQTVPQKNAVHSSVLLLLLLLQLPNQLTIQCACLLIGQFKSLSAVFFFPFHFTSISLAIRLDDHCQPILPFVFDHIEFIEERFFPPFQWVGHSAQCDYPPADVPVLN